MMTWPKPVQKPHPPVIVGGMFPHAARRAVRYGDGWIPHLRRPQYEDVTDYLPQFRQLAAEIGRDPAEVPITVWGVPEDLDRLKRYRDQGVARGVVQLAPEGRRQDPADPRPLGRAHAEVVKARTTGLGRRTEAVLCQIRPSRVATIQNSANDTAARMISRRPLITARTWWVVGRVTSPTWGWTR